MRKPWWAGDRVHLEVRDLLRSDNPYLKAVDRNLTSGRRPMPRRDSHTPAIVSEHTDGQGQRVTVGTVVVEATSGDRVDDLPQIFARAGSDLIGKHFVGLGRATEVKLGVAEPIVSQDGIRRVGLSATMRGTFVSKAAQ
jgi:hypothetical protein